MLTSGQCGGGGDHHGRSCARTWVCGISLRVAVARGCSVSCCVQMVDTAELLRPWALSVVNRVLVPSQYHASKLSSDIIAQGKATVTRHGLEAGQIMDGVNAASHFIYASSPSRGLEQVVSPVAFPLFLHRTAVGGSSVCASSR